MKIKRYPNAPELTNREKLAVEAMEKAKFKPKFGEVYYIFECGCIGQSRATKTKKGVRMPVCPEHIESRLLTKYKKCQCGTDWIGLIGIQGSKTCAVCANAWQYKPRLTPERRSNEAGNSIAHKPEQKRPAPVKVKPGKKLGVRYEWNGNVDWDILLAMQDRVNRAVARVA